MLRKTISRMAPKAKAAAAVVTAATAFPDNTKKRSSANAAQNFGKAMRNVRVEAMAEAMKLPLHRVRAIYPHLSPVPSMRSRMYGIAASLKVKAPPRKELMREYRRLVQLRAVPLDIDRTLNSAAVNRKLLHTIPGYVKALAGIEHEFTTKLLRILPHSKRPGKLTRSTNVSTRADKPIRAMLAKATARRQALLKAVTANTELSAAKRAELVAFICGKPNNVADSAAPPRTK